MGDTTKLIDDGTGWVREARVVRSLELEDRADTVEIEFTDSGARTFVTPTEWAIGAMHPLKRYHQSST